MSNNTSSSTTNNNTTNTSGASEDDIILSQLPGRLIDITQQYPPEDFATAMKRQSQQRRNNNKGNNNKNSQNISLGELAAQKSTGDGKKPVMVVVYVGGITYMEIAALRFLNRRPTFPYHIIIITTQIINGSTFLQSLV